MAHSLLEDYDAIRERRDKERRFGERAREMGGQCAVRIGRSTADCWCYGAAERGGSLPCPPLQEADPLAETRKRIREMFGEPFWAKRGDQE